MRKPDECRTKQEIRSEIDRLDQQLIAGLAERFAYVRRMAELKQAPDEARVQHRIDDVLDKVGTQAETAGFDRDLAREIWLRLIDWNIEYERRTIAARNRDS